MHAKQKKKKKKNRAKTNVFEMLIDYIISYICIFKLGLRHLAETSYNNDVKKAANGALWILDGKEETSVEKAALQQGKLNANVG